MLKFYTRFISFSKILLAVIFLSIAGLSALAGSGETRPPLGGAHPQKPSGTAPVLGVTNFDGAPALLLNSVASGTVSPNVLSSGLDIGVVSTPSTATVKLQITAGGGAEHAAPSPAPDGYIRGLRVSLTSSIQSLVFTSDDGSTFNLKSLAVSMSMLTTTDLGTITITPYTAGVPGTAVTLSSVVTSIWQTGVATNFVGINEFIVSAVDNSGGYVGTINVDDILITAKPVATTSAATAVAATTATLNGTVNDNFDPATTSFKYGTDPALAGATTVSGSPATTAGTGVAGSVTANLTGLTPGTKYYFEIIGANTEGTATGTILNFTTTPSITVTPASPAAATVGASYTSTTFSASDLTWRLEVPVQITMVSAMVVRSRTSSTLMSTALRSSSAATASAVRATDASTGPAPFTAVLVFGAGAALALLLAGALVTAFVGVLVFGGVFIVG